MQMRAALALVVVELLLVGFTGTAAHGTHAHSAAQVVASGQALADAVEAGVHHVLVAEHLDFSNVEKAGVKLQSEVLYGDDAQPLPHPYMLEPSPATSSIRGNCTVAPPQDLQVPTQPGQCVLSMNAGFIHMPPGTALWLDRLLLRVQRPQSAILPGTAVRVLIAMVERPLAADAAGGLSGTVVGRSPRLFMTHVSLLGDSIHSQGMLVENGRVFAENSNFSAFRLYSAPGAAVTLGSGADAAFVSCSFTDNRANPASGVVARMEDPVVIESYPGAPGPEAPPPAFAPPGESKVPSCLRFVDCYFSTVRGIHTHAPGSGWHAHGEVTVEDWGECAVQSNTGLLVEVGSLERLQGSSGGQARDTVEVNETLYQPTGEAAFLDANNLWLRGAVEEAEQVEYTPLPGGSPPPPPAVRPPATAEAHVPVLPGPFNSEPEDLSARTLAGIAAASCVVTMLVAALALWLFSRQRATRQADEEGSLAGKFTDLHGGRVTRHGPRQGRRVGRSRAPVIPAAVQEEAEREVEAMLADSAAASPTSASTSTSARRVPPISNIPAPSMGLPGLPLIFSHREMYSHRSTDGFVSAGEVCSTLDDLHIHHATFPGGYRLLPCSRRWQTRLGVLQPARSDTARSSEVVLEFFISEACMNTKMGWYSDALLRPMLPSLLRRWETPLSLSLSSARGRGGSSDDGSSAWGGSNTERQLGLGREIGSVESGRRAAEVLTVPPGIAVEAHVTLEEWRKNKRVDFVTAMQLLFHVVERLKQLHGRCLVHCSLTPSSIIWIPGSARWSITGFETMADIGVPTEVDVTLQYSPPEVALSQELGSTLLLASPVMDIWALGIVAMELFTGQPVFPVDMTHKDISAMLAGRVTLPWVKPSQRAYYTQKLKVMEKSVLSCLQREPLARPSAHDLHDLWMHILDAPTECS